MTVMRSAPSAWALMATMRARPGAMAETTPEPSVVAIAASSEDQREPAAAGSCAVAPTRSATGAPTVSETSDGATGAVVRVPVDGEPPVYVVPPPVLSAGDGATGASTTIRFE